MRQEIIDEIFISDMLCVRVSINDTDTGKWVDVRLWKEFQKSNGKMVPTTKGIGVSPDNIDPLISALLAAKAKIQGS